jgi:hypothetical protein
MTGEPAWLFVLTMIDNSVFNFLRFCTKHIFIFLHICLSGELIFTEIEINDASIR